MSVPAIRIGTSGWSYPDWLGPFYPEGLPSREMLPHLTGQFWTVEIDSTFHRVPTERMIQRWREVAPPGFEFALKMPQTVTHAEHGPAPHPDLEAFCGVVRGLGDRLGPTLLQFPPSFRGDAARKALQEFLPRLPPDLRWAVEVRSASLMKAAFFDMLRDHGVALCITDRVRLPREVVVTAPFSYVRLLGDRRGLGEVRFDRVHIDRSQENAAWADRLRAVAARAEPVHVYINNHWSGHSPADARALMAHLGQSGPPARGDHQGDFFV